MVNGREAEVGQKSRGAFSDRGSPDRSAGVRSADADEIKRIVEVAEALGIDPQVARVALRGETGEIPTDCPLGESVLFVVDRLNGGKNTFHGGPVDG